MINSQLQVYWQLLDRIKVAHKISTEEAANILATGLLDQLEVKPITAEELMTVEIKATHSLELPSFSEIKPKNNFPGRKQLKQLAKRR